MGLGSLTGSIFGSGKQVDAAERAQEEWQAFGEEAERERKAIDVHGTKTYKYGDDKGTGIQLGHRALMDYLFGGKQHDMTPSAQFASRQGIKAAERAASSRGYNMSGNVLFDVGSYATGVAQQDYWQNINLLLGMSGANADLSFRQGQAYLGNKATAISGFTNAKMAEATARANKYTAIGGLVDKTVKMVAQGMSTGNWAGAVGEAAGEGGEGFMNWFKVGGSG